MHPSFQAIYIIFVIVNIVIIALVRYDENDPENDGTSSDSYLILSLLNLLFLFELVFKFVAYESKQFFRSVLNVIDVFLCILFTTVYVIDQKNAGKIFILNKPEHLEQTRKFMFLTAFRALRMIQIAKSS